MINKEINRNAVVVIQNTDLFTTTHYIKVINFIINAAAFYTFFFNLKFRIIPPFFARMLEGKLHRHSPLNNS